MKKILICLSLLLQNTYAQKESPSDFKRHSIEVSGSLSGGQNTSVFVFDRGSEAYYSNLQVTRTLYLDISPVLSFFLLNNFYIYASPALSISKEYYSSSPLYPDRPSYATAPATTSENDTVYSFVPYFGLGYVFSIFEKFYLAVSLDAQRVKYKLLTRLPPNFQDESSTQSLTRFNLRITPKIRISERTFLNFGIIVYYETDRLMTSFFGQTGFGAKIDLVSANVQAGLSYVF